MYFRTEIFKLFIFGLKIFQLFICRLIIFQLFIFLSAINIEEYFDGAGLKFTMR